MKKSLIPATDIDRPETWVRYRPALCNDCSARCCSLPVEVRIADLIRMELIDPFEAQEPLKNIAKKLLKARVIEHFNGRDGIFTLSRMANDDCIYLDSVTRRCTIYAKRPDTCRNHPRIGPRPGFCAHSPR